MVEKGERDGKTTTVITTVPVGYGALPEPGGILDQPCWTMAMFDHFRSGEVAAAEKRLN